jgi:RimJ/RimL family protein N-acetyltransferase
MWITPITLTGNLLILQPIALEHEQGLIAAACDGKLWDLWFTSIPTPEHTHDYINAVLAQQQAGLSLGFAVIDQASGQLLGSTRFCNIDAKNRRVEIGYTWYRKSAQRTGVNTECKLLLLQHAFENLQAIAVEFRSHTKNHASRAAITRLGAKQDGILRQHQILSDGSYRDTVVFSILDSEWPIIKHEIQSRMDAFKLLPKDDS